MAKKAASKTAKSAKKKKKKAATTASKPSRQKATKTTRKSAKTAKTTKARKQTSRAKTAKAPKTSQKTAQTPSARSRRKAPTREPQTAPTSTTTTPPANEKPLTSRDVEQFRRMLLEKRAEILGDVSTLHDEALHKDRRDSAGDVSSMPIHMADLGTDNYELEFTLGLIEGERAILQEIDEALERIQQNTYGVCQATGKPIGKARLKAKPWAKYCYEYTLAQEQGQTRGYGY